MNGIKGYTPEEVAHDLKNILINDYTFCKGKLAEIRNHEKEIESIRTAYNKLIVKYRMESVDRVLEYIRSAKITDAKELDTLLSHCQNKLAGNIDGTELELTRWKNVTTVPEQYSTQRDEKGRSMQIMEQEGE